MANRYPWYEVVEGDELEQGDLLMACPVFYPTPELSFPIKEGITPIIAYNFDVVVMTQSCDLVNEKVEDVILCPHWDLRDVGQMDKSLGKNETHQAISKGRRPRYTLLDASNIPELPMGIRIVDLGRIYCLPKGFVKRFAESNGKRLRLCPPYREHLSQAFARYFMRVGLPQEIQLT